MRDKVIHRYFEINWQIVWNVITEDLPTLEPKISALLDELDEVSDTHHSSRKKP
ncbi:MAG: HepT-like ribonuclease domain-containing protein [Methanomicrobiales archaeon]